MAARFAAAIKSDFGVSPLLLQIEGFESIFDVEIEGKLAFSRKRDGDIVSYEALHAAIREATPARPARPWDLLNSDIGRVAEEVARRRLDICGDCDRYIRLTHQCRECGCVMNAKVVLPHATCPQGKWSAAPAVPK